MFGSYRTLLALVVLVHHLLAIPIIGHHAVHGFFILSGYLMTHILCHTYGFTVSGFRAFWVNRFLRLYPSYWVLLLIICGIILWFGEGESRAFRAMMYLPSTPREWLQNISLVYGHVFPDMVVPRLSPPTWALTIELFHYMLISLGLSRSRSLTWIWLLFSLSYVLATLVMGLGYHYRYSCLLAGSLPFAMGAWLYHYRLDMRGWLKGQVWIHSPSLWVAAMLLQSFFCVWTRESQAWRGYEQWGFYVNLLLQFMCVYTLSLKEMNGEGMMKKWDEIIGEYSYPLYLMHWPMAFAATMALHGKSGVDRDGWTFLASLLTCLILATLMIHCVDRPLQKVRHKVKRK